MIILIEAVQIFNKKTIFKRTRIHVINWKFLYLQNGEKYILKCIRQADIFTHLSGPRTVNLTTFNLTEKERSTCHTSCRGTLSWRLYYKIPGFETTGCDTRGTRFRPPLPLAHGSWHFRAHKTNLFYSLIY